MVLAIVLLASLALATVREMVLRPIPLAAGLATLFALVQTDAGPAWAFGLAFAAHAVAAVAQEAALNAQMRVVRFSGFALCGAASLWVAAQLVQSASELLR